MSGNPEPRTPPVPPPNTLALPSAPLADGSLDLLDALVFAAQDRRAPRPYLPALRARLVRRAAASVRANRAMVTVRHAAAAMARASEQARLQTLYLAAQGTLRPGEPLHVLLIELVPDGQLVIDAPAPGVQREWLQLRGRTELADNRSTAISLEPLDFHVVPAAASDDAHLCTGTTSAAPAAPHTIRSDAQGALLFLRESLQRAEPGETPRTVRDADTPWKPYAPQVERRVLWRRGAMAALLYRAAPGALVPQHAHGHDEECLVLRGEAFQDDCLLREGDYQLAPAGSSHMSGHTDVGAIFYIHGDIELDFQTSPTAAAAPAA
ncbi:MAG: cupin domain-containing protein [Burkholderiaceae bacterium]